MSRPGIGLALVAALVLGGCDNDVRSPTDPGLTTSPPAPARSIAELLAAPDSFVADGATYRASAFIYRNFMIGANDDRAIADVRLRSADIDSIGAFRPKYVWVIHGTETWGAELTFLYSDPRYVPAQAYVRTTAHGGPEWPVGDSIQVVTGIADSTDSIRLLRCPDDVLEGAS